MDPCCGDLRYCWWPPLVAEDRNEDLMSVLNRLVQVLTEAAPWPLRAELDELRTEMETFMRQTEEAIAAINTETDNLAVRIEQVMANADQATADQLGPIATRLRSIAADPADPVPGEPLPGGPNTI